MEKIVAKWRNLDFGHSRDIITQMIEVWWWWWSIEPFLTRPRENTHLKWFSKTKYELVKKVRVLDWQQTDDNFDHVSTDLADAKS